MIPYETHRIVFGLPLQPIMNGLAFFIGFFVLYRLRKRFSVKKKDLIIMFILTAVIGLGVGPRIFFYFGPWGAEYTFIEKLINVFNFAKPGMVYVGGFVFSILSIWVYCFFAKLNFWKHIDLMIIGTPLAQFVGRLGCYLYGCCFGKETGVFFGIAHHDKIVHPSQLYLSIAGLVLFVIFYYYSLKRPKPGLILSYYMIDFLTGRGYVIASALNEALYLVLGIPLLVIAAGFLPVSIYIAFFAGENTTYITIGLFVGVGIIEILAIAFIIKRYLRERNLSVFQYLKYIFDLGKFFPLI